MQYPLAPTHAVAFATIPNSRGTRGKRFSRLAVLTLTGAAILANHCSALAIAEWGVAQSAATLRALNLARGVALHPITGETALSRPRSGHGVWRANTKWRKIRGRVMHHAR